MRPTHSRNPSSLHTGSKSAAAANAANAAVSSSSAVPPLPLSRTSKLLQAFVDGVQQQTAHTTTRRDGSASTRLKATASAAARSSGGPLLAPLPTATTTTGRHVRKGSISSYQHEEKSSRPSSRAIPHHHTKINTSSRPSSSSRQSLHSPRFGSGAFGPGLGVRIGEDEALEELFVTPRTMMHGGSNGGSNSSLHGHYGFDGFGVPQLQPPREEPVQKKRMPRKVLQPYSIQAVVDTIEGNAAAAASTASTTKAGTNANTIAASSTSAIANPAASSSSSSDQPSTAATISTSISSTTRTRPWFLTIQEHSSTSDSSSKSSSSRSANRTSSSSSQHTQRIRNWSSQVHEIVTTSSSTFNRRRVAEDHEMSSLLISLKKEEEQSALRLESIACIFDTSLRHQLKQTSHQSLVTSSHTIQAHITREKEEMLEKMLERCYERRIRVKQEFSTQWEILSYIGQRMQDDSTRLIQASFQRSQQELQKWKIDVPHYLSKKQPGGVFSGIVGIGGGGKDGKEMKEGNGQQAQQQQHQQTIVLQEAPPEPSDFVFATPVSHPHSSSSSTSSQQQTNPISLRLPTSMNGVQYTSGIDPKTGAYNEALVREGERQLQQQQQQQQPHATHSTSTTHTTSTRHHLSLIHNGMTLLHTAAPCAQPTWCTLATQLGPQLILRRDGGSSGVETTPSSSSHTLFSTLCQHLLSSSSSSASLDRLTHREHVIDVIEQMYARYKTVVQVNTDKEMKECEELMQGKEEKERKGKNSGADSSSESKSDSPTTDTTIDPIESFTSSTHINPSHHNDTTNDDDNDSSSLDTHEYQYQRSLYYRLHRLALDLEMSNFGSELGVWRPRGLDVKRREVKDGGKEKGKDGKEKEKDITIKETLKEKSLILKNIPHLSLPSLKQLASSLLHRFSLQSSYHSRYYMEIHPGSSSSAASGGGGSGGGGGASGATNGSKHHHTNEWFVGFVLVTPEQESIISVLDVDLYSTTQTTLCLHSNGSLFTNGKSQRIFSPLRNIAIVGILIDLIHGFIEMICDGQNAVRIFGLGSILSGQNSLEQQRQQAIWITSGYMRPVFGVCGPQQARKGKGGVGGGGGVVSNNTSTAASVKRSEAINKMQKLKEEERERARIAEGLDSAGNVIKSSLTAASLTTEKSDTNSDATENVESTSTIDDAKDDFDDTTLDSTNNTNSNNPIDSHRDNNTPLLGWIVPKLSVNLGELQFSYRPTGVNLIPSFDVVGGETIATTTSSTATITTATSKSSSTTTTTTTSTHSSRNTTNIGLGSCLPMNTLEMTSHDFENEQHQTTSLVSDFKTYQMVKEVQRQEKNAAAATAATTTMGGEGKGMGNPISANSKTTNEWIQHHRITPSSVDPTKSPSPSHPQVPSQHIFSDLTSEYKHRHTLLELQELEQQRQGFLYRPATGERKRVVEEWKGSVFGNGQTQQGQQVGGAVAESSSSSQLVSWSHFPPQSIRVQQAILKVQRIARRYIGFQARRALYDQLSVYAGRIQRGWRRYRVRRNIARTKAILPIQRLWRGYRARCLIQILRKYNITFPTATRAAIHIQSFIRMLFARKKVLMLAMVVQQKIEQVRGLVIFVQRVWRRKREKRTQIMNRSVLSSVLIFQSRIRGIRLRRLLASVDPHAARQLKTIASSVVLKRKKWAAACLIQRVYRGWLGRKYVRVKRNCIERDGARIREAFRGWQLRQRIDSVWQERNEEATAEMIKIFLAQLGYNGQQ